MFLPMEGETTMLVCQSAQWCLWDYHFLFSQSLDLKTFTISAVFDNLIVILQNMFVN